MKRIALTALLVMGIGSVSFGAESAPAGKGVTVGGGVKNPWTTPYVLAIVTVPEPTTLGVLGLGAAALVMRRRPRR